MSVRTYTCITRISGKLRVGLPHVGGEGVQEGEERGRCGPRLDVEDGDTEVHPGHAEGEVPCSHRCDGDVSYSEVCRAVHNFSQHAIKVARRHFTPVLTITPES